MVEAMKNKRPVPGDIFEIRWPDERRQYFQFVATDGHALDSDIICVYSHRYSTEENISLEKILEDDVELYSHTSVYVGIRDGFWTLYASAPVSSDYKRQVFWLWDGALSWRVWRVGGRCYWTPFVPWTKRNYWPAVMVFPQLILLRLEQGDYASKCKDEGSLPLAIVLLLMWGALFTLLGLWIGKSKEWMILIIIYVILALICAMGYIRPKRY